MGLSNLFLPAIAGGVIGGIGQGASAIAQENLKRDEMARAERMNKVDVDSLPEALRTHLGLTGVTGPQNVNFIDTLVKASAAQAEKDAERNDRQALSRATNGLVGTPATSAPVAPDMPVADASSESFNVTTPGRPAATRDEAFSKIGGMKGGIQALEFLYPKDKYTQNNRGTLNTTTGEFSPHDTPDMAPEGERVDLARGTKYVTSADSNGVRRTREVPLTESDKVSLHTDRMVALQRKSENGQPLTPQEHADYEDSWRTVNTLRPTQQMPGATMVPRGPLPSTLGPVGPPSLRPKPGTPITVPGAPEGSYRGGQPVTPPGEAEKVGERNAAITMLEKAGKQAETFPALQSNLSRMSLWARGHVQGNTPIETLSDDEQRWVTMHEQLRNYLIAAQMGLGPFRSPEMQAQLKEIIGRYWSPGTPARLQELADIVRNQGEAVQTAQSEGGGRPLSMPPRGPGAVTLGGPAGVGNAAPPQQFDALPPAAQLKGRTMRNPSTGQRMQSDGRQWVPVP